MTPFRAAMPALVAHEGEWEGVYRHVDRDGTLVDRHHMWTRCEFPDDGPYAYVQHNRLWWDDGRTAERRFGGVYRDGLIHWDTDRFTGYGWQTLEGVAMLRLDRKDEPGVHFIEMITLAGDGRTRARTWQWFRDGTPFRRTLCDEWRVQSSSAVTTRSCRACRSTALPGTASQGKGGPSTSSGPTA